MNLFEDGQSEGGQTGGEQQSNAQKLYGAKTEASSGGEESGSSGGGEEQQQTGGEQQTRQGEQQTGEQRQQTQRTTQQREQAPTLGAGFAKEMATALREAGVGAPQQTQQTERKEMTDEEFRKVTRYYQVPAEDVIELFGKPPVDADADAETQKQQANAWIAKRQAILQRQLDGMAQHSVILAGLQTKNTDQQLRSMLEPITAEQQQRKWDNTVKALVEAKPVLKSMPNGAGAKIIKVAYEALKAERYTPQGATAEERDAHATAAIYAKVKELASLGNPNFNLDTAPNTQAGGQRGGGRAAGMASAVNGAGGSGGQDQEHQDNRTNAQKLYVKAGK